MIKRDPYFNKVESQGLDMPEILMLEDSATLVMFSEIYLVETKDVDHGVGKICKQTPQSLFVNQ